MMIPILLEHHQSQYYPDYNSCYQNDRKAERSKIPVLYLYVVLDISYTEAFIITSDEVVRLTPLTERRKIFKLCCIVLIIVELLIIPCNTVINYNSLSLLFGVHNMDYSADFSLTAHSLGYKKLSVNRFINIEQIIHIAIPFLNAKCIPLHK